MARPRAGACGRGSRDDRVPKTHITDPSPECSIGGLLGTLCGPWSAWYIGRSYYSSKSNLSVRFSRARHRGSPSCARYRHPGYPTDPQSAPRRPPRAKSRLAAPAAPRQHAEPAHGEPARYQPLAIRPRPDPRVGEGGTPDAWPLQLARRGDRAAISETRGRPTRRGRLRTWQCWRAWSHRWARWLAGLHSSPLLSPKKCGGGWNWKGCQFPPWSRCCKRRQRAGRGRRWRSCTPGYREPLRLT